VQLGEAPWKIAWWERDSRVVKKKKLRKIDRAPGATGASDDSAMVAPSAQDHVERRIQDLSQALEERSRELQESLKFQTATNDVLRVISSSPTDIRPVLDTVGENAARLCEANNAVIFRVEGGLLHHVADYGQMPTTSHPRRGLPVSRNTVTGRAVCDRRTIHIHDLSAEEREFPEGSKYAKLDGHRTTLATPLLRKGNPVGAILIRRNEVRPFSPKQIELVTTFADQAAIAIENVRLFEEIQEKSRQVEEQAAKLAEWNQKLEERVNEQVKRIGRLDRLKRFLSPHVAELVTESNNESLLESHRQYITTLFCDLRGFTAFSENIEPEESMELLRSYHEEIGRLVFKFDGTIDHRAGDGLMVIFNDPVPCDAPVEQALNLAFAMRDRVRELAKVWQKRGYELGFGIGITSGYATLGIVGFEGRFDYTANGNVVNLAARLCDIAKNDQIIISQNVYSEIENLVDAKPLPDLHLKGIRRPVRAFNVVRLRKNPGAITGSEAVGSPDCE
jgi:class 3 adenylate cyclase